jgi:hypothetical protein
MRCAAVGVRGRDGRRACCVQGVAIRERFGRVSKAARRTITMDTGLNGMTVLGTGATRGIGGALERAEAAG